MKTWLDGRTILREKVIANAIDLNMFVQDIQRIPLSAFPVRRFF